MDTRNVEAQLDGLQSYEDQPTQAGDADYMERKEIRRLSNFDMESITRLSSSSQSYQPTGTAVNVTRTLSLDQQQWERLIAQPTLVLAADDTASQADNSFGTDNRSSDIRFRSIIHLPMISPFSKFSLIWHMLMLIMDLTYTAFAVPIGVGFDVSDTAWTWAAVLDFTAGLIFMVDLVLGFHTGYVISHNYKRRIVMDGRQVAHWYVVRGSFWVDSLSSVAWVTQIVLVILTVAGTNQERLASQIQIMRILRLARLGRLFKVLFLSGAGQGLLPLIVDSQKFSATAGYFLQLLYAVVVTINFIGCLWFWVADREGITDTWITSFEPYMRQYGGDDGYLDAAIVRANISRPRLYLTSIYWAFTTVATVGYGDITPQTAIEEGITIFVFLIGIIFFGVIIGSLTQLLQRASKDARKAQLYREKMEHVDRWLRGRRFPNKLRKRIRDYYIQFWLRQAEEADESGLLKELPHTLRTEALWSMSRKSLVSAPVFADVPTPLLFLLASHIQPRMFPPGHDISLQGGPATKMWMLHFGQIVPVFNDVEGEIQAATYLLNSLGILQDVEPSFQKNLRGYRTSTACGLWEWKLSSIQAVCKHHAGLFAHISANIVDIYKSIALEEPESFPPAFHNKMVVVQKKLEAKAEPRQGSVSDVPNSQQVVPLSPFEIAAPEGIPSSSAAVDQRQDGGDAEALDRPDEAGAALEDAAARGSQLQRRSQVSFSQDTKEGDGEEAGLLRHRLTQASAADLRLSPQESGRGGQQDSLRSTRVSIRDVDSPIEDLDEDILEAEAQEESAALSTVDLARSLSAIQDQLAELRALVRQGSPDDY